MYPTNSLALGSAVSARLCWTVRTDTPRVSFGGRCCCSPDTGHRTDTHRTPTSTQHPRRATASFSASVSLLSTAAVFALTGCFGVALTSSELGHRPIARLSSESLSMSSRGQFKRQSRSHSSLPSFFANGNHRTVPYSRKISVLVDFEIANIPKTKSTAYSKLWSVR